MTQLLQNAVYGTALILAVAVLRGALKDRLLPEARLALWAVCLFRLFTPAAPTSALSLWGLFRQGAREASSSAVPVTGPVIAPSTGVTLPAAPVETAPATPAAPMPPAAPAGAGVPWGAILPAVWIAVGVILAARYALAYARTRRAVGRAIPLGREDARYAALPKCARLREGPMDGAPLTFGVVRPTVVLFPGLEGPELACVLAHEGVHARRRHNLWHYAAAAALTVFWWDPAVWLMARLIRRDVELSCDRAAVRRLGADRRAEYATALVTLSTQAEGGAFCHGFGPKRTEERIISIMKYKKTTVTGLALTLALVLAVTVGFASDPGEAKEPEQGLSGYVDALNNEFDQPPSDAGSGQLFVVEPEENGLVRVSGDGFCYDMPAEGWNTYGPYILDSAYGTGSLIEIYETSFCESEVEDYQRLGYTKIRETEDLAVLAKTEVLEYSDGVVNTIRREVYVFGHRSQERLNPGCMMELRWIEENLTAKTANEPEIMRAIARSFTITTALQDADQGGTDADGQDGMYICIREDCGNNGVHEHDGVMYREWRGKCTREDCPIQDEHYHDADGQVIYIGYYEAGLGTDDDDQDEAPICLREDCPIQPSVHFHKEDGSVDYVYSQPSGHRETDADDRDEAPICLRENCPIQPSIHFHNEDGSVSYISNDLPSMVDDTGADGHHSGNHHQDSHH